MHLQTLGSVGTGWDSLPSQVCANGDVTIHPNAAIAPGVILQAAPNSRIIIAEGVCVGMGAVLNAYEGTIEIDHGATLGAGVLVVGCGKIGSRACVGASTTIFNQSIAPWQVVPAGSLIGDSSRSVEKSSVCDPMNEPQADPKPEATPVSPAESAATSPEPEPQELPDLWEEPVAKEPVPAASESVSEKIAEPKENRDTTVYGQVYVNRILFTIFPQNRPSNSES